MHAYSQVFEILRMIKEVCLLIGGWSWLYRLGKHGRSGTEILDRYLMRTLEVTTGTIQTESTPPVPPLYISRYLMCTRRVGFESQHMTQQGSG